MLQPHHAPEAPAHRGLCQRLLLPPVVQHLIGLGQGVTRLEQGLQPRFALVVGVGETRTLPRTSFRHFDRLKPRDATVDKLLSHWQVHKRS